MLLRRPKVSSYPTLTLCQRSKHRNSARICNRQRRGLRHGGFSCFLLLAELHGLRPCTPTSSRSYTGAHTFLYRGRTGGFLGTSFPRSGATYPRTGSGFTARRIGGHPEKPNRTLERADSADQLCAQNWPTNSVRRIGHRSKSFGSASCAQESSQQLVPCCSSTGSVDRFILPPWGPGHQLPIVKLPSA